MPHPPGGLPRATAPRVPYLIAAALALLLIGVVFWRYVTVNRVERRAAAERTELISQSREILATQTHSLLRLTAKPFVWAIRKEMLRENYEQVNEYLVQFVKEPQVQQVLVADAAGLVLAATDKKLEGRPLGEIRPALALDADDTAIAEEQSGSLLVVSPVMGLNSRLGTLLFVYSPQGGDLGAPQATPQAR